MDFTRCDNLKKKKFEFFQKLLWFFFSVGRLAGESATRRKTQPTRSVWETCHQRASRRNRECSKIGSEPKKGGENNRYLKDSPWLAQATPGKEVRSTTEAVVDITLLPWCWPSKASSKRRNHRNQRNPRGSQGPLGASTFRRSAPN